MVHHENCPVCKSSEIESSLLVKDFSVSGKEFAVWTCQVCSLRFTQDAPIIEEIGDYYQSEQYISHTDSRQGIIHKLYHLVRSYTLQKKRALIRRVSGRTSGNVLDIGCGTGGFLNVMKDAGWNTIGLEPNETARKMAASKGLDVYNSDDLFTLKQKFQVITMWHVLEHVHELHRYMNRIATLLEQEGVFIVAVPNYTANDQLAYQQYWAAYDVPRHLYHFSPASMKTLAEKHGFTIDKMLPMWFDSFYVSMLSEKYRSGSVNYISAFFNGLASNVSAIGNTQKCSSIIYVLRKPRA
jgi:2-polyprenyl-3-methyl-5-hydroxy-6-metoxy-1,4-benzoquinol methylase